MEQPHHFTDNVGYENLAARTSDTYDNIEMGSHTVKIDASVQHNEITRCEILSDRRRNKRMVTGTIVALITLLVVAVAVAVYVFLSSKTQDCCPLSSIADGLVTSPETTHGATALYSCNVGHVLTEGDSLRSCDAGAWTGKEPFCAPIPNMGCYYPGATNMYNGTRQTTIHGIICQRWDSQSPHRHSRDNATMFPDASVTAAENYCRYPDGENAPWCYTTDPNTRWNFCGVKVCKFLSIYILCIFCVICKSL